MNTSAIFADFCLIRQLSAQKRPPSELRKLLCIIIIGLATTVHTKIQRIWIRLITVFVYGNSRPYPYDRTSVLADRIYLYSYHTKLCHLVEWVICCEDFVVKSGVHAADDRAAICSFQAQVQFEHQINGYIWILLSKTAKWGHHAQSTF